MKGEIAPGAIIEDRYEIVGHISVMEVGEGSLKVLS